MLLDTTELSKKHPGIFIAGSDVVEQTLREYEMQMMLTLELSLPCGHWKKNTELKIKDPVQKSTKKRLKRLIGRMSLIMNTSKEQSKSVSFYLESELVRMYVSISQKIAKHTHTHTLTNITTGTQTRFPVHFFPCTEYWRSRNMTCLMCYKNSSRRRKSVNRTG